MRIRMRIAGNQPYEVEVPAGVVGDGRPFRLKTHQIRAVDKGRLGRRLGSLPRRWMRALDASLRVHLSLSDGS